LDRASNDHATHADPGDCQRPLSIPRALSPQSFLEKSDHRFEYLLESPLHHGVASRDVTWQRNHGTAAVDILEVLSGQIPTDNLSRGVDSVEIDPEARPTFRRRLGQGKRNCFGVKVTFGVEIVVKGATGEASMGHEIINRDTVETVSVEERTRAANDARSGL